MISIIENKRFIGRKKDLKSLEYFDKKKGFKLIIIYGRRRVGKTSLCLKFLEDREGTYVLSQKEKIENQAQNLVDKFAKQKNIFPQKVKNFKEAFMFIKEIQKKKKHIIIIDEFSYLIEEDKRIVSEFQYIVDEILKNTNLYLILLGSSISIMENEILSYKSPLYGRRTGQLKINPFEIEELIEFFPKKSFDEIIQIYGVFDSIPAYLQKVNEKENIFQNIKKYILSKQEFLFEEVDFLLNYELREPKKYKLILDAISKGKNRLSKISDETKISVNVLTNYLQTLIDLHIIKKEYPINENKAVSRNSIYCFCDNFFKFYFKFVNPNLELIEMGKIDLIMSQIKKEFNIYLSFIFEDVCKDAVRKKFNYKKVGRFWKKDLEIDVLGIGDKEEYLFGECKYKENQDFDRLKNKLKEKTRIKFKGDKKFLIFAKSFTKKNESCLDLKDLENVFKT
jgi:uncharacterized protein